MINSLAEMYGPPAAAAGKSGGNAPKQAQTQSESPFSQELKNTLEAGASGTRPAATNAAWRDRSVTGRQESGATRQNSVADGPASGTTAADAIGLRAVRGAVATVDGVTHYGTDEGWSLTAPEPEVEAAAAQGASGEELLGFKPEWFGKVIAVKTNVEGQPTGTMELSRKMYATEETAKKLADALGATPVAADVTTALPEAMVPQWELDFGGGIRLNAGLVADMFMRDADRAIARLRAEIGV
jgi:hypothetical protein